MFSVLTVDVADESREAVELLLADANDGSLAIAEDDCGFRVRGDSADLAGVRFVLQAAGGVVSPGWTRVSFS